MPRLRSHRRDHRARAPARRKYRNLVKFIPEADSDFAFTANNFLSYLRSDPAGHGLAPEDLAEIEQAVTEFRQALTALLMNRRRNPELVLRKRNARARAEEVVRRWGNIIRANPDVDASKKTLLRLKGRPERLRRGRLCDDPPVLRFMGTGDGTCGDVGIGNGSGVHVLELRSCVQSNIRHRALGIQRRMKPDGATRAEVFVELVPPGAPMPRHPAQLTGRPWYLGSFSTSRIEVRFPIPSEPMLVVYWARWADEKGNVSRFSQTCVAGWAGDAQRSRCALPAAVAGEAPRIETKVVYVQVSRSEPAALPDYGSADHALEDYDAENGARPDSARRPVEAVEVKRLPEQAA